MNAKSLKEKIVENQPDDFVDTLIIADIDVLRTLLILVVFDKADLLNWFIRNRNVRFRN